GWAGGGGRPRSRSSLQVTERAQRRLLLRAEGGRGRLPQRVRLPPSLEVGPQRSPDVGLLRPQVARLRGIGGQVVELLLPGRDVLPADGAHARSALEGAQRAQRLPRDGDDLALPAEAVLGGIDTVARVLEERPPI